MSNEMNQNHSSDADLLTRVGIALTLRLRHTLYAVHISADHGAVTLRGEMPTFYDRQLAIEITRRVAGVLQVVDELSVAQEARQQKVNSESHVELKPNAVRGAGTEASRRLFDSALVQRTQPARGWKALFGNAATVLRSLFLGVAVVAATGCGSSEPPQVEVFPAKGSITFQGKPIPGAIITLHPATPIENVPQPRANVDKDGTFTVKTYAGKEGAPEGDYKVTVLWYKPIYNGPDFTSGPNVIPQKYTQVDTTDIQIKIAAGQNDIPTIQL